jgi:hypothetical protein
LHVAEPNSIIPLSAARLLAVLWPVALDVVVPPHHGDLMVYNTIP